MLGIVEEIDRRQPRGGVSGHGRQRPPQPLDQHFDARGVEHVGAELHRATDSGRLTGLIPALSQEEIQIHPGGVNVDGQRRELNLAQSRPVSGCRQVLPRQHHLNQRVVGQGAGRVEPLHQQLERHVLVFVGGQAARLHLGQKLPNTGITGQINPQHQGVDEKPDQIIEHRVTPPGDREPDRHIGTVAQFGKQDRQRGLHHHESGRLVLPGNCGHLLLQFGRPVDRNPVTAVIGHRRVGPISRNLQVFWHPGQGLFPIRQLGGDAAVRVFQLPQLGALPQRVIHILHGQRRPARRLPHTARGVSHLQIA